MSALTSKLIDRANVAYFARTASYQSIRSDLATFLVKPDNISRL